MKDSKDSITMLKGDYGEKIIIDRLQQASSNTKYFNVMKNILPERHLYDLMVQKWTLTKSNNIEYKIVDTSISKIDVKTFPPLRLYPDSTGINESCWLEYKQIPEILIIFIDLENKNIYGDFVYNLIGKEFILKTSKSQDRICWKINELLPINKIIPEINPNLSKDEIYNLNMLNKLLGYESELKQMRYLLGI